LHRQLGVSELSFRLFLLRSHRDSPRERAKWENTLVASKSTDKQSVNVCVGILQAAYLKLVML
jgi:hypothetical protein